MSEWQGKRIQQARRSYPEKMTQEELGRRIGKSRNMVARYESGLDDAPVPILNKIAKELRVPLTFLLEKQIGDKLPLTNSKNAVTLIEQVDDEPLVEIPYWGEVPAGDWQMPVGDDTAMMRVEKGLGKANRCAVRVAGDSMLPRLRHGDVVHIELSKTPREGCITLARNQDNELTLKALKHVAGQWELHSFNPEYPNATSASWEILGYAVVIERHYGPERYLREVDGVGIRVNPD